MTREEAIALYQTSWWEHISIEEAAMWQLFEDKLCMPWSRFHEGVEKLLKRPVFTHEFASESLRQEALGLRSAPTLSEIMEQIPVEKRYVITASEH